MSGNLGYELNLLNLPAEEEEQITRDVALYKQIRDTVQLGRFYRLKSPYTGNETAWCVVAPDGGQVVATHVNVLAEPTPRTAFLRLTGLEADAQYRDIATGQVYGGDELMYVGLSVAYEKEDFSAKQWIFEKC